MPWLKTAALPPGNFSFYRRARAAEPAKGVSTAEGAGCGFKLGHRTVLVKQMACLSTRGVVPQDPRILQVRPGLLPLLAASPDLRTKAEPMRPSRNKIQPF